MNDTAQRGRWSVWLSLGDQNSEVITTAVPTSIAASIEAAYAITITSLTRRPATGTTRRRTPERPSCVAADTKNIVEINAAVTPTSAAGNERAARSQYGKPRTEVIPEPSSKAAPLRSRGVLPFLAQRAAAAAGCDGRRERGCSTRVAPRDWHSGFTPLKL
jgi:hypothetical protein